MGILCSQLTTWAKLPSRVAQWNRREIVLHRITQILSALRQRPFIFLVEEVKLRVYIVGFIIVIFLFGALYAWLTPHGHGIGHNLKPLSDITFFKGVYFSIVTISSLGYGHMHPMGFSKALACSEVLVGLAMIGIMIAKVTSQRMSYHVSRVFATDAQKRLEIIAVGFETSQNNLTTVTLEFERVYPSTPSQMVLSTTARNEVITNFQEIISALRSKCVDLRDYLLFEIEQDNYFQIAPTSAMVRVGNAVDEVFFRLSQLIISLSPQARNETLNRRNRLGILEAIDSQRQVCNIVRQHATDQETQNIFRNIENTCERVPASYFEVPEEPQPDQVLQGTDEPQELSREDNEQTDSS